ncbi:hypothetical protein BDU57DRAFT_442581 [Ampelomyces quisqualis]|uniref:Ecp2 effector protein-like domain-containing protein n=1 Tax=Ampelomyces quisqualis TaxID=50730 RepID=A0A6A5QYM8_AMPQU|nr:hypothetical protein BDU57DRAFT_442581 [Ampelomyces quisqualis]
MRASILLVGLLSTITGAQINLCAGQKGTPGHCDTITFVDRTATSTRPPTTAECQDTCRGILSDAGDWVVDFTGHPDGYRQVLNIAACGFSMGRAPGEPKDYQFNMDNQDIVDILDEVSKRFAPLYSGRVAAEGIITCQGRNATWAVDYYR